MTWKSYLHELPAWVTCMSYLHELPAWVRREFTKVESDRVEGDRVKRYLIVLSKSTAV